MRIFAGQEPSGVWIGWVTPDYHQYDPTFDLTKVRNVTVTVGDDKGNIHDRSACCTAALYLLEWLRLVSSSLHLFFFYFSMKHSNCYMVWGGDLVSNQQTRFSQEDMVVGCLVDLATGLMTFTANGKEINTFYQVKRSCEVMCGSDSVLIEHWPV